MSVNPIIEVPPTSDAKAGDVRYAVVFQNGPNAGWLLGMTKLPGGNIGCQWGAPAHALLFNWKEAHELAAKFGAGVQKVLIREVPV